jgi:hypothetical protein
MQCSPIFEKQYFLGGSQVLTVCPPLTAENRVRSHVNPYEIFHAQTDTVTGFPPSISVFSPISTIPPTLHTHLHLHVALTGRTNGPSLGTIRKATLFRQSGSTDCYSCHKSLQGARTSKKTHRGNNHCQGVTHSSINSHHGFDTMWLSLLLLPLYSQSQSCHGTTV